VDEIESIVSLLAHHAGLDSFSKNDWNSEIRTHAFNLKIASLMNHPLRDQRPDILEQELESARKEIRLIIRRIEALDGWALSVARRATTREADEKAFAAAGSDNSALLAALERAKTPVEEWPDKAAIKHLKALEIGLKTPIETLIEKSKSLPSGKGAKPNLAARKVALKAGWALIKLTGKPISYWRDSTAYANLTTDLFRLFGIKADTRRPCEWALSELAKIT
jgi:hypothetical protein